MSRVTVTHDQDVTPICPHCDREIATVLATEPVIQGRGAFTWGKRTLYVCGSCRRVLPVSHRKGVMSG